MSDYKGAHVVRPDAEAHDATVLFELAVALVAKSGLCSQPACSAAAEWISDVARAHRADGDEAQAQALWTIAEVMLRNVRDLEGDDG